MSSCWKMTSAGMDCVAQSIPKTGQVKKALLNFGSAKQLRESPEHARTQRIYPRIARSTECIFLFLPLSLSVYIYSYIYAIQVSTIRKIINGLLLCARKCALGPLGDRFCFWRFVITTLWPREPAAQPEAEPRATLPTHADTDPHSGLARVTCGRRSGVKQTSRVSFPAHGENSRETPCNARISTAF